MPASSNRPVGTVSQPVFPRLAILPLLALVSALASSAVHAQTPGREPALLELIPGARSLALGMALQVSDRDPDLAFVHPALAVGAGGIRGGYTAFGHAAGGYTLSAGTDWFGGGVAVSLHSLEYLADPGGPGLREAGLDDFLTEPPSGAGVSESAATLTYARTLFGVQVGVSGRFFSQRFAGRRSTGEAVDLGAATSVGPLKVALSARNLGGDSDLPEELVLGAGAYGRPVGPLDLGAAAQLRYRDDGEVEVGAGLEFGYWPIRGRTFVGRVGVRNIPEGSARPVTVGGSFWGDSLVLDYAFQPMEGLDGIHRITVGWR
ncbi:MAG TPA: hypothetical protein VLA43_13750, partial [Longimicrobiales bacterium]|nr:hypothetical protein [Longimicrobiales bacterium]